MFYALWMTVTVLVGAFWTLNVCLNHSQPTYFLFSFNKPISTVNEYRSGCNKWTCKWMWKRINVIGSDGAYESNRGWFVFFPGRLFSLLSMTWTFASEARCLSLNSTSLCSESLSIHPWYLLFIGANDMHLFRARLTDFSFTAYDNVKDWFSPHRIYRASRLSETIHDWRRDMRSPEMEKSCLAGPSLTHYRCIWVICCWPIRCVSSSSKIWDIFVQLEPRFDLNEPYVLTMFRKPWKSCRLTVSIPRKLHTLPNQIFARFLCTFLHSPSLFSDRCRSTIVRVNNGHMQNDR